MRAVVISLLSLCAVAVSAQTAPVGGVFTDIGAGPTGAPLVGTVRSLVRSPDGTLYAAGGLYRIAGVPAQGVARWDGSGWSLVGGEVTGSVLTLAVGPDGSVYAGGYITAIGEQAVSHVARWDGTAWHALGGQTDTGVRHLAVGPDGSLYAGGDFRTIGGVAANQVARWDGAAWHALGDGVTTGDVSALAVGSDGTVYAGGASLTAGTADGVGIAQWDGTAWTGLGLGVGVGGDSGEVHTLAAGPDGSVVAAGWFDTAGGVPANHIARWDGTAWSALGSGIGEPGTGNPISALAVDAGGGVVAGGTFATAGGEAIPRLARWNGTEWAPLGSGVGGASATIGALATGPDGVYVGGAFDRAGDRPAQNVARWAGGNDWLAIGVATVGSVQVVQAGTDGSLYAAGEFTVIGDTYANRIARWDGTAWAPLGSGVSGPVHVLAPAADGSLYVGGGFYQAGGVSAWNVARWDGAQWSPLGAGVPTAVHAMAVGSDGTLYTSSVTGTNRSMLRRWDGAEWTVLGSVLYGGVWKLLVGADGVLYAGGEFAVSENGPTMGVARWDGTGWQRLGTLPHRARDLAFGPDGTLHLLADRYHPQAGLVTRVLRWNGSSWEEVGTSGVFGPSGDAYALTVTPDGRVYVGGQFLTVGGVPMAGLAVWDGATWNALPTEWTGTPGGGIVMSLASWGDKVAIGGGFQVIGGVYTPGIALFTHSSVGATPGPRAGASTLSVGPNPASRRATAWIDVPAGRATVAVYDALGRRVALAFEGEVVGRRAVDLPVARLAPGVYVVRLTTREGQQTARLVVAR